MKKKYFRILLFLWILLVVISLTWNIFSIKTNTEKLVKNIAETFFEEIKIVRLWNSMHDGVYVPITKDTKPNKYLVDKNREIETTEGLKLTKINPAYMTRQISEISNRNSKTQFKLISLKPLNPKNIPDEWERKQLEKFKNEKDVSLEQATIDDKEVYRYIAPLMVEKKCLKCHAIQGYKEGDVRGGLSVIVQSKLYNNMSFKQMMYNILVHMFFFITGILIIYYINNLSKKYIKQLSDKNIQIKNKNKQIEENRKQLITSQSDLEVANKKMFDVNKLITENQEEIKSQNDALKISEKKFRIISNTAPIGLTVSDQNGNNIYSNKTNQEISGLNYDEFLNDGWQKIIHPDDKEKVFTLIENWKTSENNMLESKYRYKNIKTGEIKWVDTKITKMFDDTNLIGYICAIDDITEKLKIQENIKQSELILKTILTNINSPVYVIDVNTYELLFVNKNFINSFKKNSGKCYKVTRNFSSPCSFCINKSIINNKNVTKFDEYYNKNNGKWYYLNSNIIKWIDDRDAQIVIATDISKQKSNESVLRKSQEKLSERKKIIEAKNRKITNSINYAKRIQNAILPSKEFISNIFDEHFILYKPKDIVSGDFYYVKEINDYIIIAAADSTGHGVPGALMSMMGISLLNDIVSKTKVTRPCEALDKLRVEVKKTLNQKNVITSMTDGLDMSLCTINKKTLEMQYAGANNPIFVIKRNNNKIDITQMTADRMPISISRNEKPFTNHTIKLEKSDRIYFFSDGYYDQINLFKKRKLFFKNFKNLIISIQDMQLNEQKEYLNNYFVDWQSGYVQIDDVLVMAVQI